MQPQIYGADNHSIDTHLIDPDAIHVIERLRHAGHAAYLVGGGVRDLLFQRKPKDFDISTSAKPEEIKGIFRRQCILIGRRFRLAHIRFGKKIIEVSTFRAGDPEGGELILTDNVWGTEEEDVLRRDFTINGLFYDPAANEVIDYVGGMADIHKEVLRTIGEPAIRFKQDPVRMLRLLKFRARFGFAIDEQAQQALLQCREEISKSAPARILEELLRMLESGSSAPFYELLAESDLLAILLPTLQSFIQQPEGKRVFQLLSSADRLHQHKGRCVLDRATLFSCLFYPLLEQQVHHSLKQKGKPPTIGEILMMSSTIVQDVAKHPFSRFPRRLSSLIHYILTTQFRLTPLSGKRHPRPKMLRSREFGLALAFLKLRALIEEKWVDVYKSWKELYKQVGKHHHLRSSHTHSRRRPRRRPPRRQEN